MKRLASTVTEYSHGVPNRVDDSMVHRRLAVRSLLYGFVSGSGDQCEFSAIYVCLLPFCASVSRHIPACYFHSTWLEPCDARMT